MHKALQRASQLLIKERVLSVEKYFQAIESLPGANRIFRRIKSASNQEELEDYLVEIKYILIFAGLGFQIEIEPHGKRGPDLKISRDGNEAVVEIMRFRKIYPGPPEVNLSSDKETLSKYGNLRRDIAKAFDKVLKKLSQVGNEESMIAIWNDDEDMEELEVKTAVANLRDDAEQGIFSLPRGLLFLVYGSKWVRMGDGKQLYCFPFRDLEQLHQIKWQIELESSSVESLIWKTLDRLTNSNS